MLKSLGNGLRQNWVSGIRVVVANISFEKFSGVSLTHTCSYCRCNCCYCTYWHIGGVNGINNGVVVLVKIG